MANSDKTAEYAITADPSGFTAGMDKAASASKDAAKQIEGHFNALGSVFGKLTGAIGGVMAVLAGGAAFKSAIDATKAWGGEVGGLSKQLGITTAEAAAMNVALKHLGIDQEVVSGAVDKMNKTLVGNAQAYEVLGIKTKDANGAWRTGGEILPEVADKLRGITNATQQNIAGQQIFGKGWSEAKAILKLTSDEMEKARLKVKELHLETDPGQVKKYKESMNDLKLITTSLQVQLGNALMPTLTTVGKYLGEEGPAMGNAFARVLQTIAAAGMTVWEELKGIGKTFGGLMAAAVTAMSGDFKGAKNILSDVVADNAKAASRVGEIWKNAYKDVAPASTGGDKGGGGPALGFKEKDGKADKEQSRVAAWEEKLAIDKDGFERQQQLAGTMAEFSKEQERDYWKKILDTVRMSAEERTQVDRKFLGLEHQLRHDAFETQIAEEKAKLENFRHNFAERITIAQAIYDKLKAANLENTKEGKEALGEIAKEQRKLAEQTLATNKVITESNRNKALAELEFAQQDAELRVNLRQITCGQLLELEQGFEAKRYQIKMQALQEEEALLLASPDRNPVALAALHAQLEDLERQHQLKLQQIKGKAVLEQNKGMTDMFASMQGGLQRVIAGTLDGSMKMRDIFKNLFGVVVSAVTEMLAKTAAQWLMNLVLTKALGKASAASEISANAGVAGAAATASAAAIPMIGWMIAPEAGAAASAAAMAFMPMASARGGYDIPAGVNPITQLHEEEMVLPERQANVIRDLADGGGNAPIHIHGSPDDSIKLKDLGKVLKKMNRNFEFVR